MMRSALVVALVSWVLPFVLCVPPAPISLPWLKHEGISCASVGHDYRALGVIKLVDCQELCIYQAKCRGITTIADTEGVFCWLLLSGVGASQAKHRQVPLDLTMCERNQRGADTYEYFLGKNFSAASDAIDEVEMMLSAESRQLFGIDEISSGLNFAAGIVGDVLGAIGNAVVEAFRLAMRLLRALIIMVKTIVQVLCNLVGEIMDSAGDVIATLVSGATSFFSGSLTQITNVVHIGFTTSALVHDHIVQMMAKLPSMITGALQMDGLLEASEAVLAVNPFGRPPYDADANGLQEAANALQSAVFQDGRRLSSRRRFSSPRRRAPTRKDSRRRQPPPARRRAPPPPPADIRRRAPPISTKVPKKTPKTKYAAMGALGSASSNYRKSSRGRKDSSIMRKVMSLVQAYYLYSNACEFYQASIEGVTAIASIFPGGFEEKLAKLGVTLGETSRFEDFVLSSLLADEVLSCPYTTCTSSLFSTGWENMKKVAKAVTGEDEVSELPTAKAPTAVISVAEMKVQRKCRSGKQCVPEGSKCMHPRDTKDPCTADILPKVPCGDSSGFCLEVAVHDENQWYVGQVNETYFSACPQEGMVGVQCRENNSVKTCYWMDPSPACAEDAEEWCFQPGAYVPAPGCTGSPAGAKRSAYFPESNLYYSYTFCGGVDYFPNQVNDTCLGASYLECKSPCVWSGGGMAATTLCRNKRTAQSITRLPEEPEPSSCGGQVEQCLGMYSVLQSVLSSPQATSLLLNHDACKAAMETMDATTIESSCTLLVTREALKKGGYDAGTSPYPANYLSNCTQCGSAWAEPAIHECRREAIDSGDAPMWCSQPVCYVSAQIADSEPSNWFPGSGLFYSYKTCGSFDVFSLGRGSCATINTCTASDGCEITTDLDDPFCCVEIKENVTTTADYTSAAVSQWASLGPLVRAMIGFAMLGSLK